MDGRNDRVTVVLVHGLFGRKRLLWWEYFCEQRRLYEAMGMRVLVPSLPWAGTIEQRAHALAEQLVDEPGPLHLVTHSMGGLDSRYWISRLGGHSKVASLTMLGCPHRGSPVADHVCSSWSPLRFFAGVQALTSDAMRQFNANNPDHGRVVYRSYAGVRPLSEIPWFARRHARMAAEQGDNDGLVPLRSAERTGVVVLPADHFELMALNLWLNPFQTRPPFDVMPIYRDIGEWILKLQAEQGLGN